MAIVKKLINILVNMINLLPYFVLFYWFGTFVHAITRTPSDIPALKRDIWISDPDKYLTEYQFFEINSMLDSNSYLKKHTFPCGNNYKPYQVAVLVVEKMDRSYSGSEFAETVFNKWGLGYPECNNGVLLFLSIKDKILSITPGSGITSDVLSDFDKEHIIIDAIKPYLKNKRYGDGLRKGVNELVQVLCISDISEYSSKSMKIILFMLIVFMFSLGFIIIAAVLNTIGNILCMFHCTPYYDTNTRHTRHTTHNYHHDSNNVRWYNPFSWNLYNRNKKSSHNINNHNSADNKVPQGGTTRSHSSTTDTFASNNLRHRNNKPNNTSCHNNTCSSTEKIHKEDQKCQGGTTRSNSSTTTEFSHSKRNTWKTSDPNKDNYIFSDSSVSTSSSESSSPHNFSTDTNHVSHAESSVSKKPEGGTTRQNSSSAHSW